MTWKRTDYPADHILKRQAKKLHQIAKGVRLSKELRLIPLDDTYAHKAGEPYENDIHIRFTDETGREWNYVSGMSLDGKYMGTAQDWQVFESGLDWIPDFFTNRIHSNPTVVDDAIEGTADAAEALWHATSHREGDYGIQEPAPDDAMTEYADADGMLSSWSGVARNTFSRELWTKIPPTFANQASLANAMAYTLVGYRDLLADHRIDTLNLIEDAITALEGIEIGGGMSLSINLALVAAVATVAAGFAAAPLAAGGAAISASGSAGLTMLAGASALPFLSSSSVQRDEPKKRELGGDTVHSVLEEMGTLANELGTDFDAKTQDVASAFDRYLRIMEAGSGTDDRFMMPRPTVIGESERMIDQADLDTEHFDSQIR